MRRILSTLAIVIFMAGLLSSCSKQKACAAYSKVDIKQSKEVKS